MQNTPHFVAWIDYLIASDDPADQALATEYRTQSWAMRELVDATAAEMSAGQFAADWMRRMEAQRLVCDELTNERKLGWHSQPTAQVIFDGVRVPGENLVGGLGEGFRIAMMGLDGGRLNIGACSLGGAQRCLDEAIAYTKDRKQFGTPVADFQNTQYMLADMATELEAARYLLYFAAAKVTADAPDKTKFAAMAKRLATDTGSAVVDRALQLHGGYGYLTDYPIERFWRDLRVHSILEGTNQVMRMIVGRELTRQ
jgi:alkylation response protein AidB-like acyl-CoA dehydrogenase